MYLSISKKSKLVPAKSSPRGQISTRKKTPLSYKMTLSTSFQNDQQHERQDMAAICFLCWLIKIHKSSLEKKQFGPIWNITPSLRYMFAFNESEREIATENASAKRIYSLLNPMKTIGFASGNYVFKWLLYSANYSHKLLI